MKKTIHAIAIITNPYTANLFESNLKKWIAKYEHTLSIINVCPKNKVVQCIAGMNFGKLYNKAVKALSYAPQDYFLFIRDNVIIRN